MASRKFDAVAWARENVRNAGGPRCRICSHPEAAAAVRAILAEIDAGRSRASVASIREPLSEHFGVNVSLTSLWFHVREHVRRAATR